MRELVRSANRRLQQANRTGEEDARAALQKQGIQFVTASTTPRRP